MELFIERLSTLGEGVAQHEGRTVFVQGAAPGERVRVRLEESGKVLRGELLEVISPGPARRVPACRHASVCGGCDWLHLEEAAQREAKQEIVLSALEHVGGIPRSALEVRPVLASPRAMGYRRRAVLHWGRKPGPGGLGFFGRRSHDRVVVDECPALAEPLRALPGALSPHLAGLANDAEAFHLLAEGEARAVAVFLSGPVREKHVEACEKAIRALKLAGAVLVPKEGSPRLLGKPVLRSQYPLRPEVPLFLRPDAFSQANGEGNVGLVTAAAVLLGAAEGDRVLELYSGNGNFTFALAGTAASVLGVESSSVGVELAQRSAREGNVANVRFVQGDVDKVCAGLAKEGEQFDLLLADPPRTGAPRLSEWAKAFSPKRVVYVACDPTALARDAARLKAVGYQPRVLQIIDMFPQTHHVEAVLSFDR